MTGGKSLAHILCVDDDPTANEVKRKLLDRAGHQVDLCVSADAAMRRLAESRYDAMITDWRLGEVSARRVIQAARELASETLVVVVSGFVAEAFQSQGPAADLYLDKPVDPSELLMILDALLRERHKEPLVQKQGPA